MVRKTNHNRVFPNGIHDVREHNLGDALLVDDACDNQCIVPQLAAHDSGFDETTIENYLEYDSFGKITHQETPVINHVLGCTGRDWDEESGMHFHRARYFDPVVGRFISEDPIGFEAEDANLFRYVENTPLDTKDPMGTAPPATTRAGVHDFDHNKLIEKANSSFLPEEVYQADALREKLAEGTLVLSNLTPDQKRLLKDYHEYVSVINSDAYKEAFSLHRQLSGYLSVGLVADFARWNDMHYTREFLTDYLNGSNYKHVLEGFQFPKSSYPYIQKLLVDAVTLYTDPGHKGGPININPFSFMTGDFATTIGGTHSAVVNFRKALVTTHGSRDNVLHAVVEINMTDVYDFETVSNKGADFPLLDWAGPPLLPDPRVNYYQKRGEVKDKELFELERFKLAKRFDVELNIRLHIKVPLDKRTGAPKNWDGSWVQILGRDLWNGELEQPESWGK